MAKRIGESDYGRCLWFAETTIDYDTEAAFEREIGIAHPLCEILSASPAPCLIVFDSFERYSPRAQRLAHPLDAGAARRKTVRSTSTFW